MGKVWERTRRGAKKFAAEAELNKTYYVIEECVQPWGNEPKWNDYTFTKKSLITGHPMCGSMSAERLVLLHGPVYDYQPQQGMTGISETPKQLFEPFGGGKAAHGRSLEDDAYPEITAAEKAGARR